MAASTAALGGLGGEAASPSPSACARRRARVVRRAPPRGRAGARPRSASPSRRAGARPPGVAQRPAERLALAGVRDGGVERGLRHADRERADARPEEVERAMATPKPSSTLAEHRSPSTRTPSKSRRPIGCGESRSRCSPRGPALSRGTTNAVMPSRAALGGGAGEDACRRRPRARWRSSSSSPVSRQPSPSRSAARPARRSVRARLGLAQRERGDRVAAREPRDPLVAHAGLPRLRIG